MIKYTVSDIDERIISYKNKLQELKTAFLEGIAVNTGVIVVRMMNVVKDTSRFDILILWSDVHKRGIQRN